MQPKTHPKKLYYNKQPQPQVKNKRIRQYNIKLQLQPASKTPNSMRTPIATSFQLQLLLQQNPKSTLKTTPTK
jgi:hypothetical protein